MKRFSLDLSGYELAEVQKVGEVVRFELHSDATTIILDFGRDEARAIADALHGACHRDLWRTPELLVPRGPEVLCGGDHCSGLWNLPCDSPDHPRPQSRSEKT